MISHRVKLEETHENHQFSLFLCLTSFFFFFSRHTGRGVKRKGGKVEKEID